MEQQQPYPAPQPPYTEPTSVPVNVLAIVSLVLGAGSFVLLGPLASLPGIITGYIAKSQIARSGERGSQLALWGIVLGYINVGLAALTLIGAVLAALGYALAHH